MFAKREKMKLPQESVLTLSRSQKRAAKKEKKKRSKELRQQKKRLSKQEKAKRVSVLRKKNPTKASDCIWYQRMYENGICEVEPGLYSVTLSFSDVNYKIAQEDEQTNIFSKFCDLMNYLDPTIHLQFGLITQHMDEADFRRNALFEMEDDDLAVYRQEMNTMIMDKAMEGQNGLIRHKYVTISVQAGSYDEAVKLLHRRVPEIKAKFAAMNSQTSQLNGLHRLRVIQGLMRPNTHMDFDYSWLLTEDSLTTKDFIGPSDFNWKPEHDDSTATYHDRYSFGEKIGKTVYLRDIAPTMKDNLLELLCSLPFDLAIAVHVDVMDQQKAIEMVRTKLAYMEQEESNLQVKASNQGRLPNTAVPRELLENKADCISLLNGLIYNNQKIFKTCLMVHTYGDTNEELDARIQQIYSTVEENVCHFDRLAFEQMEAMNSILPLGKRWTGQERTLSTGQSAIFIPFATHEMFDANGIYEGLNAVSKNLIFIDRRSLSAPAGAIVGQTGSGKSTAVKTTITNIKLKYPEDDVIVIDPEAEYDKIVTALGGVSIEISPSSKVHINPMDITEDYADADNPIRLKSHFLQIFCELVQGSPLNGNEKSYIDKAAMDTYEPFLRHPERMAMPTLHEFLDNLIRQGPGAEGLATTLSMYVKGTMDIFAHQTNVDVQNHLISFNMVRLGKSAQTIGMMTVLDQVWNRITINRSVGRRTWIFTDEFQLLLKNERCMDFYFELSSRGRKWGAILTSITQHIESLEKNDDARRMLQDCHYIKILTQPEQEARKLGAILHLGENELRYITNVGVGNGMIIVGGKLIPFVNEIPSDTELYRLMDTTPNRQRSKKE